MLVDVPFFEGTPVARLQRYVMVRLDAPQAETLRRVLDGAADDEAVLANGRVIKRPADALRFVLETIATAAAE